MTSIQTARPSLNGQATFHGGRTGMPLPVRERRPAYAALAVVLIVGLALAGGYFYTQAGKKVPVIVMVNSVAEGHVIERSDLSTVDVAGHVTAIGKASLNSIVGLTAVVDLLPDTLLQRSMVSTAPPLDFSTKAQVGVKVRPGQIPADGLSAGNHVQVVQLPATNSVTDPKSPAAATVLVDDAVVYWRTADPSQTGGTLLTLLVPKSSALNVAAASNAGAIALIRIG